MSIRPAAASRIVWGVAGTGAALCFLFFTVILIREGSLPYAALGLIMVGILGFMAHYGARAAELQANETSVAYRPTVGAQRPFPRAPLASIERINGLRGVTYFSFRSADGQELFHADETYRRADMEALAGYLGVPLRWEFTAL